MIDFVALENAVKEQIDDSLLSKYDFPTLLKTAEIVWDDTAVQVTASDFVMVFDLVSYECVDYTGNDII